MLTHEDELKEAVKHARKSYALVYTAEEEKRKAHGYSMSVALNNVNIATHAIFVARLDLLEYQVAELQKKQAERESVEAGEH